MDVGVLAKMHGGEVILVDIADDPDMGQVGDEEGAVGAGVADTRGAGSGGVLRDDDAGCGGVDLDRLAGVVLVDAENVELFDRCIESSLGVFFAVLGDLQLALGDGALVIKQLIALESDVGEVFVRDRLEVVAEGGADVGALDLHDELAFFDVVAETGVESNHAAVSQREHGNLAGDVGADGARHGKSADDLGGDRLDEGEELLVLDAHAVAGTAFDDGRLRGRGFGGWVGGLVFAARKGYQGRGCKGQEA